LSCLIPVAHLPLTPPSSVSPSSSVSFSSPLSFQREPFTICKKSTCLELCQISITKYPMFSLLLFSKITLPLMALLPCIGSLGIETALFKWRV
jgi:hypothetical protein